MYQRLLFLRRGNLWQGGASTSVVTSGALPPHTPVTSSAYGRCRRPLLARQLIPSLCQRKGAPSTAVSWPPAS
ncbi:MAG: hypothetical protein M5U34_09565 [Chloroflexi bacterium]|nr:hypothetical protein [Chloroflexota bacterium]